MKHINIVYDDNFDDVDIIAVPDNIARNIESIVNEFMEWLSVPKNRQNFMVQSAEGNLVLSVGTDEFLWWLNCVKLAADARAVLVCQHTVFISGLPVASF